MALDYIGGAPRRSAEAYESLGTLLTRKAVRSGDFSRFFAGVLGDLFSRDGELRSSAADFLLRFAQSTPAMADHVADIFDPLVHALKARGTQRDAALPVSGALRIVIAILEQAGTQAAAAAKLKDRLPRAFPLLAQLAKGEGSADARALALKALSTATAVFRGGARPHAKKLQDACVANLGRSGILQAAAADALASMALMGSPESSAGRLLERLINEAHHILQTRLHADPHMDASHPAFAGAPPAPLFDDADASGLLGAATCAARVCGLLRAAENVLCNEGGATRVAIPITAALALCERICRIEGRAPSDAAALVPADGQTAAPAALSLVLPRLRERAAAFLERLLVACGANLSMQRHTSSACALLQAMLAWPSEAPSSPLRSRIYGAVGAAARLFGASRAAAAALFVPAVILLSRSVRRMAACGGAPLDERREDSEAAMRMLADIVGCGGAQLQAEARGALSDALRAGLLLLGGGVGRDAEGEAPLLLRDERLRRAFLDLCLAEALAPLAAPHEDDGIDAGGCIATASANGRLFALAAARWAMDGSVSPTAALGAGALAHGRPPPLAPSAAALAAALASQDRRASAKRPRTEATAVADDDEAKLTAGAEAWGAPGGAAAEGSAPPAPAPVEAPPGAEESGAAAEEGPGGLAAAAEVAPQAKRARAEAAGEGEGADVVLRDALAEGSGEGAAPAGPPAGEAESEDDDGDDDFPSIVDDEA